MSIYDAQSSRAASRSLVHLTKHMGTGSSDVSLRSSHHTWKGNENEYFDHSDLAAKGKTVSTAIVNAFLSEYIEHVGDVTVDRLDIWQEQLPEFDAEAINAKYKGVSGESMTSVETATWEKIRELASRFQRADRILLGVPMWNFSFPYRFKQLIDLSCQRNMLFTLDGEFYGPSLNIDKAFVAYVRGQSNEVGFKTVSQPGFKYLSGYVEFWLQFIGVRNVVSLTVEHTWDGRAAHMIEAGKRQAAALARQF
jgi:FMN-dependent NADH-azoreductase